MTRRILPVVLPLAVGVGAAFTSTPAFAKDGIEQWMDRALRNIMNVHFFGSREVDKRRKAYWEEIIPDNHDKKVTVFPVVPWKELGRSLECSQLEPKSYRDWFDSRRFDENGHPTSMALSAWLLPATLHITPSRKYLLFDDWPVHVSMAVIGEQFEIEQILNSQNNRISVETLKETHSIYEYRFRKYTENYLYERPIKVLARKQCDGFRIFDFEVGDRA